MRSLMFIFLIGAITWGLVYFLIPLFGYPLKSSFLMICASLSALYAAGVTVMGESIIEDVVKLVMIVAIAGVLLLLDVRFGFVMVCALTAGIAGLSVNQINRAMEKHYR